ncbi:MAG TPA: hypothetical protein PL161_12260 [Spirochaetota bacterium]|nr:hypothetical protein [Spirochaetota bacterium]
MYQNINIRRMQSGGIIIGFILIVFLIIINFYDYYVSGDLKYEMNNYFRDTKIQKIIIYNGSQLNDNNIEQEIRDLSKINDFIESINKTYEDYPDHPQYHIRFFVRVILENDKTYDFICKFKRSDSQNVYFVDLNNNVGDFRSQSLRRWFYKNKIY